MHALFSVSSHAIDVASTTFLCDQSETEEKRTAQETAKTITSQIWLACRGVAQPVSDLQTTTGIKDKTAQFWIDQALARSSNEITKRVTDSTTRDSRLNNRSCAKEQKQQIQDTLKSQIQRETYDWLLTQPEEKWDKLPEQSRASHA